MIIKVMYMNYGTHVLFFCVAYCKSFELHNCAYIKLRLQKISVATDTARTSSVVTMGLGDNPALPLPHVVPP